jgi:hypothetical protein
MTQREELFLAVYDTLSFKIGRQKLIIDIKSVHKTDERKYDGVTLEYRIIEHHDFEYREKLI